jgi:hypothetical protein
MTTVLPLVEPEERGVTPRAVVACAWSAAAWAVAAAPVLLHEAMHVAASVVLRLPVRGAGACVVRYGRLGPVPLVRATAFWVLHEPADDWRGPAVTLAPALLVPLALVDGLPLPVALVLLFGGLATAGDVAALLGEDPTAGHEYVPLLGSPDQWQTELSRFE